MGSHKSSSWKRYEYRQVGYSVRYLVGYSMPYEESQNIGPSGCLIKKLPVRHGSRGSEISGVTVLSVFLSQEHSRPV